MTATTVQSADDHGVAAYLDPTAHPAGLEAGALETIPVVEVGAAFAGDGAACEAAAAAVRRAHEQIGFLAIAGHGVPRDLIDDAYAALRDFFALPEGAKRALLAGTNGTMSGFVPARSTVYVSSSVNANTMGDLNENFRVVRPRPADHPAIAAGLRFHGPNQWPDLPGFEARLSAYHAAMEALGRRLLPVYARALDLPADWFDGKFDDPMWTTRNSWYPAADGTQAANQFGIAPHTDHGFITMLPVSREPGLEVLARTGRWVAVDIPDDTLLVNTGEFMHRWTNGRFFATPHRVLPPARDRYTLAFFFNPTHDVVADPIATCCGPDDPARYAPVSMYDYMCRYVDRNYSADVGGRRDGR